MKLAPLGFGQRQTVVNDKLFVSEYLFHLNVSTQVLWHRLQCCCAISKLSTHCNLTFLLRLIFFRTYRHYILLHTMIRHNKFPCCLFEFMVEKPGELALYNLPLTVSFSIQHFVYICGCIFVSALACLCVLGNVSTCQLYLA